MLTPSEALYRLHQFAHSYPKRAKRAARLVPAMEVLARHCRDVRTIADLGPRNLYEVTLLEQTFPDATVDAIDLWPTDPRIRKGDLHKLPMESGWADLGFLSHTLEHVRDLDRATREVARVLRPGGYLWLAMPRGFEPNAHDRIAFEARDQILEAFAHGGPVDCLWDGSNEREWRLLLRLWKDRSQCPLRILYLLPDKAAYAQVVTSGLAQTLTDRGHTVTLLAELEPVIGTTWRRKLRRGFLRTCSYVARARKGHPTYGHKLGLRRALRQRLEIALAKAVDRLTGDAERAAAFIERLIPTTRVARHVIRTVKPDVLVTHTSIYEGLDHELVKSAQRANVPVMAHVASWDNLTAKGGFLVRPSALTVWGEASKQHAIERHGFREEQVYVTGPAHFDPYAGDANYLDRPLQLIGVTKPIVLIAGTTLAFWNEERAMVERLAQMTETGELPVTLWYRPHPRAREKRALQGPNVIYDAPVQADPVRHLRWVLEQSLCVVAAFSTLIIEAALFGKPSLIIGFGGSTGGVEFAGAGDGRLVDHAGFEHMADVMKFPGVLMCHSWNDLRYGLLRIAKGDRDEAAMLETKRMAQRVALTDGRAKVRIAEAIEAVGVRR